jgi:carbonic anhydrase/acetyltransferase-like protein (isoleucine patch superfamily)
MLQSYDGMSPRISSAAFIHEQATVLGDVHIPAASIVLAGARLVGDYGKIELEEFTIVEENAVIHAGNHADWIAGTRASLLIGRGTIVAHGAVVHARSVGRNCLIGMNATVLEGVTLDEFCLVAAGTVVPEGMAAPAGSFIAGVPGRIKGQVSPDQSRWTTRHAGHFENDFKQRLDKLRHLQPVS